MNWHFILVGWFAALDQEIGRWKGATGAVNDFMVTGFSTILDSGMSYAFFQQLRKA